MAELIPPIGCVCCDHLPIIYQGSTTELSYTGGGLVPLEVTAHEDKFKPRVCGPLEVYISWKGGGDLDARLIPLPVPRLTASRVVGSMREEWGVQGYGRHEFPAGKWELSFGWDIEASAGLANAPEETVSVSWSIQRRCHAEDFRSRTMAVYGPPGGGTGTIIRIPPWARELVIQQIDTAVNMGRGDDVHITGYFPAEGHVMPVALATWIQLNGHAVFR